MLALEQPVEMVWVEEAIGPVVVVIVVVAGVVVVVVVVDRTAAAFAEVLERTVVDCCKIAVAVVVPCCTLVDFVLDGHTEAARKVDLRRPAVVGLVVPVVVAVAAMES